MIQVLMCERIIVSALAGIKILYFSALFTLEKLKGYSNPADGHPTFISQSNLTSCYNYRNANYVCILWNT